MHATEKALMARGLDSDSARKHAKNGWTIGKLKLAKKKDLEKAGFSQQFIVSLKSEARPPVPIDALTSVLFANRYQCCVCRDTKLSVIVHHIEEWSKSKSHNLDNLAVLCLHHHDEAHSKKTLSKNLDSATLREAKNKWEAEVKLLDAQSIHAAMRLDYSSWNYMNEMRIFEIARTLGTKFDKITRFSEMVKIGLVQPDGLPTPVLDDDLWWMYEGPNSLFRYFYVSEILNDIVQKLPIINISDYLDKGTLGVALVPGDFIFVQGAHVFSPTTCKKDGQGRGQICEGVRRANNVEVRFTFDRWEASSSSAKSCWLTGTRNQGSLLHVKDVSREEGRLVIRGTVLGICSNLGDLKTREYAANWLKWHYDEQLLD